MASFAGNTYLIIANNYVSVFFFLLFSLAMLDTHVAKGSDDKPILFIFGDSTFDVGTNNFLRTNAKANFPYNGIDFPSSIPTGRFSNGFNTADQIARQFGYQKSPPPFLVLEKNQYSFSKNILQGVNFASAGSGLLRQTGSNQWGEVVFLEKQVQQFSLVRGKITEILGPAKAASFVSNALFLISVGSNDLFDFARKDSGIHLGKEEYLAVVQLNYYSQIKTLYELGARKFGILSVPPIGCCPAVSFGNGGNCVTPLNDFAVAFYSATEALLRKLSLELKELRYSLGNSFVMTNTLLDDPLASGLKDTKSACCGSGKFNGEGPCIISNKNTTLCDDRRDHLFWDWFHPTQRASELAAFTLFGGGTEFVTPMNFSQLAQTCL